MIIIKRIREKSFSPDEKSCEGLSKTLITFLNSYEKKTTNALKKILLHFLFSVEIHRQIFSHEVSAPFVSQNSTYLSSMKTILHCHFPNYIHVMSS